MLLFYYLLFMYFIFLAMFLCSFVNLTVLRCVNNRIFLWCWIVYVIANITFILHRRYKVNMEERSLALQRQLNRYASIPLSAEVVFSLLNLIAYSAMKYFVIFLLSFPLISYEVRNFHWNRSNSVKWLPEMF